MSNAPTGAGIDSAPVVFSARACNPQFDKGDDIKARIDTVANGTHWRWSVQASGGRVNQTSLFGFPHDTRLTTRAKRFRA